MQAILEHLLVSATRSEVHRGTQDNATITHSVSSILKFNTRFQCAGKTWSLVFLFPDQKDLVTSHCKFNGNWGLNTIELKAPATEPEQAS